MEQLERAERYLNRIRHIYKGMPHVHEASVYYEDDVISFFIHCHHISDWMMDSSKIHISKREMDSFIASTEALRICADLCNAEKHRTLTKSKRTERQPHLCSKICTVVSYTPQSAEPSIFKGKFTVLSDGKLHDALELAEACMSAWKEFAGNLRQQCASQNAGI